VADVFVSYSRKDIEFVRVLVGALTDRDKEVWVDWEGIPPTVEFMEEIRGAVEAADAFLFVLSPDSATSRVCNEELDGAVALNKRIIPVVRREVPEADVPEAVAGLNWIFCREEDDLAPQFDLLLEALDTDYDWVRAHTRLLVRAAEWDRKGEEASLLLRGKDLAEAEDQIAQPNRSPEPTELQHRYVLASRRASARSQRLRLVAVTVALVVAVVLAVFALLQRQTAEEQRDRAEEEATIARSRQLAAQADSQLDVDPELSTLLALESIDVKDTPEAEAVLRDSLTQTNVVATLQGHNGAVVDVAYVERDGEPTVITAGEDGTVRFWNPDTGEQLDQLDAHEGGVQQLDVSPENGLLATTGADGTARVWDLETLDGIVELRSSTGHQPYDVAIDPAGERLATSGLDGSVAIWDLATGRETLTYREGGAGLTRAVAWTPDGEQVVSAGADQLVRVWDPDSGATALIYRDHPRLRVPGEITSVEVSPNGSTVASSSGFETLIWRISDGQLVTTVGRAGADAAYAGFSPDGSELVTGGTDGVGRMWQTQSGVEEDQFLGHPDALRAVAFGPDRERIATAGEDGTARVWATSAGELLEPPQNEATTTYLLRDATLARVTADGRGNVQLGEVGAPRGEDLELDGDLEVLVGAAFSRDGSRLALAEESGAVRVFDTESGEEVSLHEPVPVGPGGSAPPVEDLEFSPDGTRVASSTGLVQTSTAITPSAVQVWDVENGETVAQYLPEGLRGQFEQAAHRLAWLNDERVLSGRTSGEVHVWDSATGQEAESAYDGGEGDVIADLVVSADGERALTVGSSGTTRVWDTESGDTVSTHANRNTTRGGLSADGSLVATAGLDGVVEVWNSGTGDVLARYEFIDPPTLLGFDPGGGTGFFLMTLTGRHFELVEPRQVGCQQCGDLDDLIAYAEDSVTRELTDEERDRFLAT
jgi:WD40 repeat protein